MHLLMQALQIYLIRLMVLHLVLVLSLQLWVFLIPMQKLEGQRTTKWCNDCISCFFLLQPSSITSENSDIVGNIIQKDWTAGKA